MTYYRQDGGTFNNTEFKLEDLTDFIRNTSLAVHLYAWDQNNVQHDLGLLTLGGDNRFGIIGTNGDSITRVSYVVTGGAIGRHKQTRLDSLTQSAVPEPATWALTLFGFGTLGMALRRRRQGEPLRRLRLDLPATI
ncbi:MAG: PEP-CTERM sorting domain-containing protein [Proteobacteria bacterium]|nr:PEP-CTERM sorting domain-containing protein [Pseudomonadota bacterium]